MEAKPIANAIANARYEPNMRAPFAKSAVTHFVVLALLSIGSSYAVGPWSTPRLDRAYLEIELQPQVKQSNPPPKAPVLAREKPSIPRALEATPHEREVRRSAPPPVPVVTQETLPPPPVVPATMPLQTVSVPAPQPIKAANELVPMTMPVPVSAPIAPIEPVAEVPTPNVVTAEVLIETSTTSVPVPPTIVASSQAANAMPTLNAGVIASSTQLSTGVWAPTALRNPSTYDRALPKIAGAWKDTYKGSCGCGSSLGQPQTRAADWSDIGVLVHGVNTADAVSSPTLGTNRFEYADFNYFNSSTLNWSLDTALQSEPRRAFPLIFHHWYERSKDPRSTSKYDHRAIYDLALPDDEFILPPRRGAVHAPALKQTFNGKL